MTELGPDHTHFFPERPEIRTDVAPSALAEQFGPYWWFQACDICGDGRMCPATGDQLTTRPEVPLDWQRWRVDPAPYESPLPRS